MFKAAEIQRSLTAAWWLVRSRPDAMRLFDASLDGFWRSFAVIVLLIPFNTIMLLAEQKLILEETSAEAATFPASTYWFWRCAAIIIDWVLLPIILALLARVLGISQRYVLFIVARNWTSMIAMVPYVVAAILYLLGIIPAQMMILLTLIATGFVLRYRYIVTREALMTPLAITIGIVVLDFVLSIIVSQATMQAIAP